MANCITTSSGKYDQDVLIYTEIGISIFLYQSMSPHIRIYRSVVSYATQEVPVYTVGAIEKAANLPVYDSIDADVLQSYMEYSLASLIYYCLKEGACSEQSSRMTAMDNSSKNAGK